MIEIRLRFFSPAKKILVDISFSRRFPASPRIHYAVLRGCNCLVKKNEPRRFLRVSSQGIKNFTDPTRRAPSCRPTNYAFRHCGPARCVSTTFHRGIKYGQEFRVFKSVSDSHAMLHCAYFQRGRSFPIQLRARLNFFASKRDFRVEKFIDLNDSWKNLNKHAWIRVVNL